MRSFVPRQSSESERLDGTIDDLRLLRANLRDMARANRWLGTHRAVTGRVSEWLQSVPPGYTLRVLDVATGGADLPQALQRWSEREGRALTLLASDIRRDVLRIAQHTTRHTSIQLFQSDALALPFADGGVDIVTCTQALHHFSRDAAVRLLRELARVARIGVIVNDLRRSYIAYWGARLLAYGPVSPLSRHDGPLSVLRAYTPSELNALVHQAHLPARVRRASGFRLEVDIQQTMPGYEATERCV
ncbi:MAG TPA: methyltransferase domain-containing protein [Herpetosiphonaceae bacterium]